MSDAVATSFRQLCQHARETAMLHSALGLLEWDERTMMPPAAGPYRADQVALLSGEIHKRRTAPKVGRWLDELAAAAPIDAPDDESQAVVRELRRDYQKKTRLPQQLVEELSRTSVIGQQTWVEARKANDFEMFLPVLEKTIALKRQEAAAIGYDADSYDALLDDYEPGETTANVTRVLSGLRDALHSLLDKIAGSSHQLDASLLSRSYPISQQEAFGREVAAAIGFDFQAGRLDVTEHPFCGGAGPRDVRLTTRYRDDDFGDAFFSTLHEAGHGLYEQGLLAEHYGLPTGEATSLGIHESQSRLWENQVGRSRAFWSYWRPRAEKLFPETLGDASVDSIYRAVNRVEPSLIRVDADEATYNLHILIRFELEQALLNDD
ncbi:MAG: carboxypeptidase M32, partial [Planctomycetota bacterium]